MIKPGLKHPGFAAWLHSGEAFLPKTMHPTSPGSALHLAHSGALYGNDHFRNPERRKACASPPVVAASTGAQPRASVHRVEFFGTQTLKKKPRRKRRAAYPEGREKLRFGDREFSLPCRFSQAPLGVHR